MCRAGGLQVDEQICRVLDRLEPIAAQIGTFVADANAFKQDTVVATLQVVRYFNDEEGEEEYPQPFGVDLVRLPGQHQLLGWHLDRRVLDFLRIAGAELDVDEYGY